MKHQTSNTCIILAESSSGVKPSDQLSTTTFTPAFQDEKEEPAEEEEEADERLAREPSTVSIGKSPTTGLNVGAESGSKTSGIRYDYTFDFALSWNMHDARWRNQFADENQTACFRFRSNSHK